MWVMTCSGAFQFRADLPLNSFRKEKINKLHQLLLKVLSDGLVKASKEVRQHVLVAVT